MSDIQSAAATVSTPVVASGQAGNQESAAQERLTIEEKPTQDANAAEPRSSDLAPGVGNNVDIRA